MRRGPYAKRKLSERGRERGEQDAERSDGEGSMISAGTTGMTSRCSTVPCSRSRGGPG